MTLLKNKLKRAKVNLPTTRDAFEGLSQSLSPETVQAWTELEEEAMCTRGDALEIYDVQLDQGDRHLSTTL